LKAHGLPHGQIAELVGVSENTLREYFDLYQQGGLEKLKELNYHRPASKLNIHIVSLETYFREHPPASIKQAQSEIEAITGVHRSETRVREFLKKNGSPVFNGKWSFHRGESIPRCGFCSVFRHLGLPASSIFPPKRGECAYRAIPITDSGAIRSLIPAQFDQRFRPRRSAEPPRQASNAG
jgi:transposase